MQVILKINLKGQARYGNPDMENLGTPKMKIQIYRFFNMPRKNMGSNFIFRVAIYFPIADLAQL